MPDFQLSPRFDIQGVGAASGLVYQPDRLWLISDSSSFLYDYQMATQTLDKHALVSQAADHIEKAYQGKYRMVRNLPEKEGCDYADLTKERYEKQAVRQRAACSR